MATSNKTQAGDMRATTVQRIHGDDDGSVHSFISKIKLHENDMKRIKEHIKLHGIKTMLQHPETESESPKAAVPKGDSKTKDHSADKLPPTPDSDMAWDAQMAQFHLRTCKNCGAQFDLSCNKDDSCRYHPETFEEWIYSGINWKGENTADLEQWTCCREIEPLALGCKVGHHESDWGEIDC
ncbi:hypothetical protein F4779DRAFT_634028 [Xylariaceae sp. FL0662B]|nr:hypothetical protein F4779DRAFT_634028 [Xylariaceae sp. FL0662B]